MTHDQDDLLVPPDRRPLVYGGAAIVILLVAAFLFWPRGGAETETADPLADRSLVPETATTQASDESVRTDDVSSGASMSGGTDLGGVVDDADPTATGTPANPRAETRIVEDETPADVTSAETASPAESRTPSTPPSTADRVDPATSASPSAAGDWVLNVGSFSSRQNADRRAEELARKGIDAHVQLGTAGDGSPVYRVRVGYFGSSAEAKEYGEWLKSSQDLDSWAGRR